MTNLTEQPIKIAILDLYKGYPNQGMQALQETIQLYDIKHNLNLQYDVFDVRAQQQLPDKHYDIYISSGGPGSPIEEEQGTWEKPFFELFNELEKDNLTDGLPKKHALFICHSFQLMCKWYNLGEVTERASTSFGVFDIHLTEKGEKEPSFQGLPDPFYAVDSRNWQVVKPNISQFEALGAELLAIEKPRTHVERERCMMAIRFNPYFLGTQFHPEADPDGLKAHLLTSEKKQQVIHDHGLKKYEDMLLSLDHPQKIRLTQNTIIPNFLGWAINSLQNNPASA